MMRCRTGTAQSAGAFPLEACGGPGSAAHRFALPNPQIMKAPVSALALRRIRDTGCTTLPAFWRSAWSWPARPRQPARRHLRASRSGSRSDSPRPATAMIPTGGCSHATSENIFQVIPRSFRRIDPARARSISRITSTAPRRTTAARLPLSDAAWRWSRSSAQAHRRASSMPANSSGSAA